MTNYWNWLLSAIVLAPILYFGSALVAALITTVGTEWTLTIGISTITALAIGYCVWYDHQLHRRLRAEQESC